MSTTPCYAPIYAVSTCYSLGLCQLVTQKSTGFQTACPISAIFRNIGQTNCFYFFIVLVQPSCLLLRRLLLCWTCLVLFFLNHLLCFDLKAQLVKHIAGFYPGQWLYSINCNPNFAIINKKKNNKKNIYIPTWSVLSVQTVTFWNAFVWRSIYAHWTEINNNDNNNKEDF